MGRVMPFSFNEHFDLAKAAAASTREATKGLHSVIADKQKEINALKSASTLEHSRKSFADRLGENEEVARLLKNRAGKINLTLSLEQKSTLTSAAVGAEVSGVLGIDHAPTVVAEARQQLRLRDLFHARPVTMQLVDFIRVTSPFAPASMVPETTLKPENAVAFTVESETIRTIATFLPASKQILADSVTLASYLSTALPYSVNLEEESGMLYGDGQGENLHGLIPQASAPAAITPGATKLDQLGEVLEQLALAKEVPATFIVLNEADWWSIRLAKDGQGRYILTTPTIFDLTVVPTTSIAQGTYLVGSGLAPAAEICDREEVSVEISTEHADFFIRNLCAIRCEKRVALLVKRPTAFVTGTFQ